MKKTLPKNLERLKKEGVASLRPDHIKIMIGSATCGLAAGAGQVHNAFQAAVEAGTLPAKVSRTGCIGMCHNEPLVDILMPGQPRLSYAKVTPDQVPDMLAVLCQGRAPAGAFAMMTNTCLTLDKKLPSVTCAADRCPPGDVPRYDELPFYAKQIRIALRNCGLIDPENISEYIARGGYAALASVLHAGDPPKLIRNIERSGLRGRGGAGFPTGTKWAACRSADSPDKCLICNADEGDPGAYMDRSILEGDPHAVLEGMLIAAFAIGASRGFIYVRDEYPLAIARLANALTQARHHQLLGAHILETPFCFDISIVRGAGAFVCGEETALIKSIEGDWGEPRQRPPFPSESGLWGRPTVINNVETLAVVPVVVQKGARWFAGLGTRTSKGTKVFSLVGKVARIGLAEVPMGITLREIIHDIGGGVSTNRQLKAVQTGGPSGGCLPASQMDLPIDYEALTQAGSIMGSGGLIVMDDRTCMVDVSRYFLEFLEDESCGKCTPCRVGVRRMREILDDICCGRGQAEDLDTLAHLATMIKDTALCGLGKTAPNPVLSTLRYFKNEYLDHIQRKCCPAGVCRDLVTFRIDARLCTGCGACLRACPVVAIQGENKQPHEIIAKKCTQCGSCREVCPAGAILT